MRFSTLIASASLLGASIASPVQHAHHEHKRDVVYVTNVKTTTVIGNAPMTIAGASTTVALNSENTAAVAVAAASDASTDSAVTREGAAPSEAVTTTASPVIASSAPATEASSSSAAPASTSSSSSSGSFAAGARGITYSPYTSSGACKSAEEVAADMAQLQSFEVIRLYGVDCNQVENVFKAKANGQKLFLGVYYMDAIEAGIETIKAAVEAHGSWDDVHAVSIGNELVNSGAASVSQVASYVSTGRSCLSSAGYSGKVVSVDTFIAVINNPGLCEHSDFMAVNAHAYFDYNTAAEDAGSWVMNQIERVWGACNGNKEVLITESGWPSKGQTYGKAVASKKNQETAVSSIKSSCGDAVILFTAFNDYWKADGSYGVEKYWGVFSDE